MAKRYEYIKRRYFEPAATFFADKRPAGLPTTVVYPFGGGDLMSALVTYPDARDITTISLEHAGDPTRLAKMTKKTTLATRSRTFAPRSRACSRCTTRRARTCASSRSAAFPASCRFTSPA